MRDSSLEERLRDLGLSSYEAKAYVSLVSLGPSEPKKVAKDAKIPYTSAYPALRNLEEKGWVEQVISKPVTYRAKKPGKVKDMVAARLEDAFGALDRIYKTEATEDAELVYTLRGNEKVLAKVYELLRGTRKSLMVVAPAMGLEDAKLMGLLEEAVGRGAKVRAICDEEAVGLLPPGVEIRTGNQVAFDLLVDDKVALIGLPDHSACGWIDSPAVASHFKQFLELLWSTSSPV
ncbi:MAG: TrmB family transcriptional regulator [Thaumarchaeota archaeon]|nr:TrmB family transcriptional regulator [Nitrososphaerota archaeon]